MEFLNFDATIAKAHSNGEQFYFILLPKAISEAFPRRGRTSARVRIDNYSFDTILEPDGSLSHWIKLEDKNKLWENSNSRIHTNVGICPLEKELEPKIPNDFQRALNENHLADIGWNKTSTIARIDWVHWIESARQEKTRIKRINDAINMLEQGKLRVCCFDPSGFYSKAIKAPDIVDI